MSSDHAASGRHDCAMNQQQHSQGGQEPPAALRGQPPPRLLDPWTQAFWGGMAAGMAIAIGMIVVMHVIQQESSAGFGIGGSVLLVLFLGLIIGSGLGLGLAAAVPEKSADSAVPHSSAPTVQPPAPSI
jgi:hypothetical protein